MIYSDLARELGFGDDINALSAWADLDSPARGGDEVPAEIESMIRAAHAAQSDSDYRDTQIMIEEDRFFEHAETEIASINPDELKIIDFSYDIDKL